MNYKSFQPHAIISLMVIIFISCQPKTEEEKLPDAAFLDYITAYTGGVVPSSSEVEIHFNPEIIDRVDKDGVNDLASLFRFQPSLQGEAYWTGENVITFQPKAALRSGHEYKVSFNLGKLLKVPEELKKFPFSFEVIRQSFSISIDGVFSEYEDFGLVAVRGKLLFADLADPVHIEEMLTATYAGQEVDISWQHNMAENTSYFTVDSVERKDDETSIQLEWTGKPLGINEKGSRKIGIPSKNKFEVTRTMVSHHPEQYLSILFSDPLSEDQSLKGLITIDGVEEVRFSSDMNELKVYPEKRLQGSQVLRIEGSVKSVFGKALGTNQEITLSFDAFYPAVKILASGNILPQSDQLVIPFQAVNLKAVNVRVIRIYEENIPQFLQNNSLDGRYQLNRVGRPVLKKRIDLDEGKPVDFSQWNTFFLDLGELIRVEPGAIYNVRLSFVKDYAVYPCDNGPEQDETELKDEFYYLDDEETTNWDEEGYYSNYFYPSGYRWDERDNPCHVSYYNYNRFVSKNVLASNLGVMAKAGSNNHYTLVVTDLISTTPVNGAKVELLNYQQHKIAEARTNSYGVAEITTDTKPFLMVADYNGQKSYLRLDDGSSLPLSKFEVDGEAVEDGLKGYIYGDRGVWRPGDTLFLMFILEDKTNTLPKGHPVIFELIDPAGQSIQRIVKTTGKERFYDFTTTTAPDARTGFYNARVSIGNSVFQKSIRIESIKPNRLKVELDFETDLLKVNEETTPARLSSRWLHGGTASNLKATVNQIFRKKKAEFEGFKGYVFEDPGKNFYSEEKVIFDQKLDNTGKATIQVDTKGNYNAPGMLSADFMIKVFEPSGEFSIGQASIPYAPYQRFAGLKLEGKDKWGFLMKDSAYNCELVLVDPNGKPVSSRYLQVSVYRMDWRWWWNSGEDNMASYFSTSYRNALSNEDVTLDNGRATYRLNTRNMDWGRYFIKVTDPFGGHSAGMEFFIRWSRWWDSSGDESREFATMLEFKSDKEKYNIGEKATITFPSGKEGKVWISIENGSRVIRSEWVDITGSTSDYSFTLTPEMAPNVYVYISLLQPHNQTFNDLPIRLYGVIPVMAEDPESILHPVIKAPEEIKPEEEYKIKIKEKDGKPMTYTLAVVDEGLLDLTRFKTPDPWNRFFAKEALGVKTWDMYDQVIGAFGGKLERVLAIGGDAAASPADKAKLNRFKPVVQFIGPVTLKPRGQNTHKLKMPNYVGSVRVMVVAANDYPAYGKAEETIPVKQPLMVLATLPRVLGPGEKVRLPVNVFMMEEGGREVTVKVETNENLFVSGSKQKEIKFEKPGEQLVEFDLDVAKTIGEGAVTVTVSSGRDKASHHFDIEIRNPNPPARKLYFTKLEGGGTWEQELVLPGVQGSNKLKLEVSSLLPLNLARHLDRLLEYPYGCAEQITSAAFPQLYLDELTELSSEQRLRAANNVKWTIQRLERFQNRNGSFSFWPDYSYGNDYITSYVGHFLVEARKKGYAVSNAMINPWVSYQRSVASRWDSQRGNDLVQAYRLYTLALSGEHQLGPMNKLRERTSMSGAAASCLASAYALAGQKEAAEDVFDKYSYNTTSKNYYTYGSELRNSAMKLEALMYLGDEEESSKLAFEISQQFGKDTWYSTQTTAYVLQVVSKFSEKHTSGKELKYTYSFDGGQNETVTTPFKFNLKEWDRPEELGDKLSIVNEGEGDIFIRLAMRGTPLQDDQPAVDKNLKVRAKFRDAGGKVIDVYSLPQGMDFKAEITVNLASTQRSQDNLALSLIVPSGWEILHRSETGFEADYNGKEYDYQDIRDDRVYTFFDLNPGQEKTFTLYLNATYQGKFFMPAISCEAMYDDGIYSRTSGKWVRVVASE